MSLPAPDSRLPAPWLFRHGESTWNTAGLARGHHDEAELTERGRRQAAGAAAPFGYRPVRALDAYLRGVPVDQMTWRPADPATIVRVPDFGPRSRGGNR
jgi:hypothetical protein